MIPGVPYPGQSHQTVITLSILLISHDVYLCALLIGDGKPLRFRKTLEISEWSIKNFSGRSAVRLAHLLWEQGAAGSNPAAPTK